MSGSMLFLLGLLFVAVPLFLLLNRRVSQRGCVPFLGGIFLLAMIGIGGWELYRCEYYVPGLIRLAGHISDTTNPRPNNYLVILYREGEEIARATTGLGEFDLDRQDAQNDGYFELIIPNEYHLTRCEMPGKFRLGPPMNGMPASLWYRFNDLEAGDVEQLDIRDRGKRYTLAVLSESSDHFPPELAYRTYLDPNGNVTLNLPIKTYRMDGIYLYENTTVYTVHPEPAMNFLQGGLSTSTYSEDVRNAWVIDGTPRDIAGPGYADEFPLDINNCAGTSPVQKRVIKRLTFIHEVEFDDHARLNYDLAQAALKAGPTIGFSHGQISVKEVPIDVDVRVGDHIIYMIYWHDLWKTGSINMAVGEGVVVVPFRARMGIQADVQPYWVDCP